MYGEHIILVTYMQELILDRLWSIVAEARMKRRCASTSYPYLEVGIAGPETARTDFAMISVTTVVQHMSRL